MLNYKAQIGKNYYNRLCKDNLEKMNLISFVLLSGGASKRMGRDKGLVKFGDKPLIMHVLNTINEFLDLLNLESQIPVKVVLHDYLQQDEYLDQVPLLSEDQIIIDEEVWNCVYSDIPQPPQGSMFGVWTAMNALRGKTKNIFVLPCDAPFVSEAVLSYMLEEYFRNDKILAKNKSRSNKHQRKYTSYIPRWMNGKFEPLFAIYNIRSINAVLEKKILSKLYSFQITIEELLEDPLVVGLNEIQYEVDIREIPIEEELARYDQKLVNFIDIDSSESLKSVETLLREKKGLSQEI